VAVRTSRKQGPPSCPGTCRTEHDPFGRTMRTHALRRALSPALLAAAFALVWLWPATAQAGTYDVSSCTSSSSVNGWSVYGSASFQEGIACPSNGDLVHRGLAVANAPNIGTIGSSGGGLRF